MFKGWDWYQFGGFRECEVSGPVTTGFDKLRGGTTIITVAIEGNGSRPSHRGGGFSEDGASFTLNSTERHAVAYGLCSYESNAMRSDNPESGIYEAKTSRTLDNNGGNPACHQGGMAIVDNNETQYRVRRLTPLECERLQGFPAVREVRFSEMTKDEYIAYNIQTGNIIVDAENGVIYGTRGPGGAKLPAPKKLEGALVGGYRVHTICNGKTRMQCKEHRIVWIAVNGVLPDGYVIDHINNVKDDNRISNLQLVTPKENSSKARDDGLYRVRGDAPTAKIDDVTHDLIQYIYSNTDATVRELGEFFGISKSRVGQIIHDVPWTDIGEWTDSKGKLRKTTDGARYKALGNSIALPYWKWMLRNMAEYLPEGATMASLFDGIGGFPLCWEEIHGAGTAVWASEIEEFPIAVTKARFPDAT